MNDVSRFATPPVAGAEWLFVATFANGGSTALAKLLVSAPGAVMLHESGEAQWLVPAMTADGQAYDPETSFDWDEVRRIWLGELENKPQPSVVVEKSPPHLVRMRKVLAAFADMPCVLVRLTRDPYAVCASWAKRYSPAKLASDWGAPTAGLDPEDAAYFEQLGCLYGERARYMVEFDDVTDLTLSYEDLAEDPAAALAPLVERLPLLAQVDPEAKIAIKDYPPQRLENMNARQIARLTPDQRGAVATGLAPYGDAIAELGYTV